MKKHNLDTLDIPLNLCWNKACLPKEGIFLWGALQKKILIVDRLWKLGFEGLSRCPLCEGQEEDVNHLILNCEFSQECWDWLSNCLKWCSTRPLDIMDFLKA